MKYFKYGVAGAIVLFAAYLCFFKLGTLYFADWDEAWYAEMTKEALNMRQFIVPYWNHVAYFDKPLLYIWVSAFFSAIFGLSEFSIRIGAAISGFITILLITLYANKKWGIVPALFAFFTLALNNVFIARIRSGNLDALVTLLITLTFFATISKSKYRAIFLGLLFGLTYLTKASLVILPIGIFVVYELLFELPHIRKNIGDYAKVLGIFIVLSGGWLFLGYLQAGKPFLMYYLFNSDQEVSRISLTNFKLDYWSYSYYSLQRRFFYLFVIGIAAMVMKIKQRENVLILLFSLALLIQLSFTTRNNNWYLLPSMPFWSLTIAYSVYFLSKRFRKIIVPFYLILILLSSYICFKTYTVNITPIFATETNQYHVETAKKMKVISKPSDIIVRMDNLYPSEIYYSNRRVLASPSDASTGSYFISRKDVVKKIHNHELHWIFGTSTDVDVFLTSYHLKSNVTKVNEQEEIARFD
jgi:4-amino-4-deoxy-L-arabinose transferase-like glycosyltransferase